MAVVHMLRACRGCPDGFTSTAYNAGEVYDLPDGLAACFIDLGAAEPVVDEPAPPAPVEADAAEVEAPPAHTPKARRGRPRKQDN